MDRSNSIKNWMIAEITMKHDKQLILGMTLQTIGAHEL